MNKIEKIDIPAWSCNSDHGVQLKKMNEIIDAVNNLSRAQFLTELVSPISMGKTVVVNEGVRLELDDQWRLKSASVMKDSHTEKPWSAEDLKEGDIYWELDDETGLPVYSPWEESLWDHIKRATKKLFPTKEAVKDYKANIIKEYEQNRKNKN